MTARSNITKALESEALEGVVTFTHNKVKYTIPTMLEWDHEALVCVEQNKIGTLVEAVLSAEDLAKFKATKPKMKDTLSLAEAILVAAGTSVEKSEG